MTRRPFQFRFDLLAWWLFAADVLLVLMLALSMQFGAKPHGNTSALILIYRFPVEFLLLAGALFCSVFLLLVQVGVAIFRRPWFSSVFAAFATTTAINLIALLIWFFTAFGCQSPGLEDYVSGKDGHIYFFLHSPPPLNGPGHYVVADRRAVTPLFYVARTVGSFGRGGKYAPFVRHSTEAEAAAKELWGRWSKGTRKLPD